MSTAPLVFTGVSSFSSDFQTIISRQVAIAQIPITQLQNRQSDNTQRVALLANLNNATGALGASIAALGVIGGNKGLVASSSDPSSVTVINTGTTQPISYKISAVQSLAAPASETSLSGYADSATTPVSATGSLQLIYGSGPALPITLGEGHNNLIGLRDAINALDAGVTATIITTGTGANPNYLNITANSNGATTLKLQDNPSTPVEMLTSGNQGSNAVFKLNGLDISKTSNSINDVIPGAIFNLLNKPAGDVTLTFRSDRAQLRTALADLATKYNAAADQVDAQMGSNAGLLNGDYAIRAVIDDMRQLTTYRASNNVSLASLGITFDSTGRMSFDATAVNSFSDSQLSDAFAFLGSSSSGFGLIASKFTQLTDPVTGLIQKEQDGLTIANQRLSDQITNLNDRLSLMRNALSLRLQKADAAISSLQSQQQVLTASVQATYLALFGKDYGNTSGS